MKGHLTLKDAVEVKVLDYSASRHQVLVAVRTNEEAWVEQWLRFELDSVLVNLNLEIT